MIFSERMCYHRQPNPGCLRTGPPGVYSLEAFPAGIARPMTRNAGASDELVARLGRADPVALAAFFCRHRDRLRRMVALRLDHRLNGRVSPSDILQEAYIDALRRLPHYFAKPDMPLFGWLRLI